MDSDSDLGVICDWSSVDSSDATSLPTCTAGICSGHKADDELPFDISAATATEGQSLSKTLSAKVTNQQLYDWLDPTNDAIPYVYDSFKYEHCAEQGIYIGSSTP